tara:strand:+ start:129 stop:467 length:339 start_codon:yes stop_codon:yes gene_type:complete
MTSAYKAIPTEEFLRLDPDEYDINARNGIAMPWELVSRRRAAKMALVDQLSPEEREAVNSGSLSVPDVQRATVIRRRLQFMEREAQVRVTREWVRLPDSKPVFVDGGADEAV